MYKITLLLAFIFQTVFIAQASGKTIHSERSLYRNILVDETGDLRCLKFKTKQSKSQQSCLLKSTPNQLVFNYTKLIMSSLLLQAKPKNILIIGLGGGTLSNVFYQLYPNSKIINVELDDAVTKVARQYFGYIENDNIITVHQDGRIFIKRAGLKKQQFDLIILDAFNGDYIPEHLLTKEFLTEIKAILSDDGVLAANTFSSSKLYQHESATYQAVFGDFYNVRGDKHSNRIILASHSLVDKTAIKQNEQALRQQLAFFGVNSLQLRQLIKIADDFDKNTRVLTDQYSPANLLNY
jgi:spermidine synthase